MFLEQYIDYLTFERRFSAHTIGAYRLEIEKLGTFLSQNQEPLASLGALQLRNYLAERLEAGAHPNSVNRTLSALRTYFKFLLRENHIDSNPTVGLRSVKKPKKLPVVVDATQLIALLDDEGAFSEDFEGCRDHLVMEFLFGTGVRLAELLNLRIDDLDFYNQQVVVTGKRKKSRIIPLHPGLTDFIQNYLRFRASLGFDSQMLFLNNHGKPAYPQLIYRIVHKYLSRITSIRQRSPHVLRHTFATSLLDQGADLNAIKELLGHANLAATQVYTHNTTERLKSIYKQAHPRA